MTTLLFPDNTVLVNFALTGRIDLFELLVQGRGCWTHTISVECARSAAEPGLSDLERIADILGAPLIPNVIERQDTRLYRYRLAGPGDPETAHLGEAEALAIIARRRLPAVFVTDDRGARTLAREEKIPSYDTADLIRLLVRAGRIEVETAWTMIRLLRGRHRATGAAPGDLDGFRSWCLG